MVLSDSVKKLRKFLEGNKIPKSRAAAALGVSHVTMLNWLRGRMVPQPPLRAAIETWTSGAVPAAEWQSSKERAAAEKAAGVKPFEPEPEPAPASEPAPKGEPHAGAAE